MESFEILEGFGKNEKVLSKELEESLLKSNLVFSEGLIEKINSLVGYLIRDAIWNTKCVYLPVVKQ